MEYVVYIILGVIVIIQIFIFANSWRKISKYKETIPNNVDSVLRFDDNTIKNESKGYPLFNEIIKQLNNYLENNKKQTSDYHLMRDVIERNIESKDNEIATQIPFPLYAGLMGTMLDILIGVSNFVSSGGVSQLMESANGGVNVVSTKGIDNLLWGVSLAMLTGALGILLTSWGANKFKNARKDVEKKKNSLLSWVQAKLLPNLSTNLVNQLSKLGENLVSFNNTFAENTQKLGESLSVLKGTSEKQNELLQTIERLKINDIASANVRVLDKLQSSMTELEKLGIYLNNTESYLKEVRLLNDKLDKSENREKMVEGMATYFKNENEQIEIRKTAMVTIVGEIDTLLSQSFDTLKEKSKTALTNFGTAIDLQNKELESVFDNQKTVFKEKLDEIGTTISERNKSYSELCKTQEEGLIKASEKFSENTGELKELSKIREEIEKLKNAINSKEKSEPVTVEIGDVRVHSEEPSWLKPVSLTCCGALLIISLRVVVQFAQYLIELFK